MLLGATRTVDSTDGPADRLSLLSAGAAAATRAAPRPRASGRATASPRRDCRRRPRPQSDVRWTDHYTYTVSVDAFAACGRGAARRDDLAINRLPSPCSSRSAPLDDPQSELNSGGPGSSTPRSTRRSPRNGAVQGRIDPAAATSRSRLGDPRRNLRSPARRRWRGNACGGARRRGAATGSRRRLPVPFVRRASTSCV